MLNKYPQTINFILISISLHLMMLLAAGICFDFFSKPIILGSFIKEEIINSYLETDETHPQQTIKQLTTIIKQNVKKASITLKPIVKPILNRQIQQAYIKSKPTLVSNISRGENSTELLSLLHSAIQAQQHYPMIAQQMEREGRVTIKFRLFTNGNIDNIHIINSSGTESLDEAALLAVNAAVPFKNIDKYLQTSHEYTVDVVFQMA